MAYIIHLENQVFSQVWIVKFPIYLVFSRNFLKNLETIAKNIKLSLGILGGEIEYQKI